MWCALANVKWTHENGDVAAYSFRAAGDVVAAVRGEGDYLDRCDFEGDGVVTPEIKTALTGEGWTPEIY